MNDSGDLIILAPLGKTKCFIHCKIGDGAKEDAPGVYVQGGVTRKVTGIFEDVINVEVSMSSNSLVFLKAKILKQLALGVSCNICFTKKSL